MCTSPASRASEAGILSPSIISSFALAVPTTLLSLCVPPQPGIIPRFISGFPSWADSSATLKSHANANSRPPPRQYPCIAATKGFEEASILSISLCPFSEVSTAFLGVRSAKMVRSAPVLNALSPSPLMTTHLTSSSASASSMADDSSSTISNVKAFILWGLLRVIHRTFSFFSSSMFSYCLPLAILVEPPSGALACKALPNIFL